MMRLTRTGVTLSACLIVAAVFISACNQSQPVQIKTRAETIPATTVKMAPETDAFPPVLHSDRWQKPVPLDGPINTAGAEDSPFITPDGNNFYFFFTPDVSIPAEKQLLDGVTGIWWSRKVSGNWTEPERVVLNNDLSLDGCEYVQGDTMWFCSVRKGNIGEIDIYTAKLRNGKWTDWRNAGEQLNEQYGIGEFHLSSDGNTIYFHWTGHGGLGGVDIWKSEKTTTGWGEPVNLGPKINSAGDEGWPFLSSDGNELWFCGQSRLAYSGPAVFRSLKMADGSWGEPEEIISNFAGEPTLDDQGNIYFVHHFYSREGKMLEADIYVAYLK
jgi:WD40-like Beta Propeller Repeat